MRDVNVQGFGYAMKGEIIRQNNFTIVFVGKAGTDELGFGILPYIEKIRAAQMLIALSVI